MVEATAPDRINRLFVGKKHHGKGVGRSLMEKIESGYEQQGTIKIKVRSSKYAVKFYQKLGYKKTTGLIKTKFGFVFQPMVKILERWGKK